MDYKKVKLLDVEGDEIVISGIAGRFPNSDNIKHLQQNLLNKVDLGSDDSRRWIQVHPEIPQRTGKINNMEKFDAEYFDIPFDEVPLIDPMGRMLLEHTYEAIVDAGINPKDLHGTRTGVFLGVCFSESEGKWFYEKHQIPGSTMNACSKAFMAYRISHWLGITGPSYSIDSACSSSLTAMEHAYRSMRSGECDAAIVGGANLCLHPNLSLTFARLGVLAYNGICKPFDENANGYMRSETVGIIYLQKAKKAKRIYATVVHAKSNCDGYKEQGITFPSSEMQAILFQEFYDECGISPSRLIYMEAHGTGTRVGDPEEVNALERIFCKDKKAPLLIGSVKSNLGHSEAAAGICQIAKVVIAIHTGIIPPNLNFTQARKGVKAFDEGSIRVVDAPTPWKPGFVGVNSFGFGGANCHILLQSNQKEKVNGGAPNDDLPRLVIISGRTEQAVESLLNEIENQPIDIEYIRLLHDLYSDDIKGHPYRGYAIIESKASIKEIKEIQYYSGKKKPICFVFSGLGSQWPRMGQALLRFPTFHKTVEKCDAILRIRGMRIIDVLTSKDQAIFNNVLNSLVGITVMQIGLVDLLKSVNVMPNYVVGHSIGELCCGYVTGNFTMEQVLLSSYYIGLALNETKVIHGAIADIGISYENAKNICPPDIDVICNNNFNTCTISGPKNSIKAFITKLQINNIFTKEINCSNIPLHSRYMASARATILSYLNRIIPHTMTHNQMWQSSFHGIEISCAEYFTNSILNPVFFKEIAQLIPKNAITLEIAPNEILQNAIKELFDTTSITLQCNYEDNVAVFLQGLGKIYNNGLQPQLANLYPTVQFPVSRGTPMISPSIKWNHSEDCYVASYKTQKKITSGERIVKVTLKDELFEYISGHVIDGRNLLPATGYLVFIWDTISMLSGQWLNEIPIVFENVKFLRATHIPKQGDLDLTVMVQKGTGNFEIIEGGNAVVTGRARIPSDPAKERLQGDLQENCEDEEEVMKTKDIYKELKLRGYQYTNLFRGLKSSSTTGKRGHIAWTNNWVTFMDNMLQIKILGIDMRSLYVPTEIRKLVIDSKLHTQYIKNITAEEKQFPVRVYKDLDTIVSGGIEMRGIKATSIFRRKSTASPVLEEYRFVAHRDRAEVSLQEGIIISTHLALEYHQTTKVNIIELIEHGDKITSEELASPLFLEVLDNLPLIKPNINLITRTDCFNSIILPSKITISQSMKLSKDDNAILIAGFNLLTNDKSETLKEILSALKDDGFLLTRGQALTKNDLINAERYNLEVVLEKRTIKEHIVLLKKRGKLRKTQVIYINNYEFSWLEQLTSILNEDNFNNNSRIILVGQKDLECGLLGLVNCLRREPGGELIRGVFIQDETAPEFSLDEPLYANQLKIDLITNVLRPGKIWGSYRHLPLSPLAPKLSYHAFVNQMIRGDLSSFHWIEGPIVSDYQDEDLVRIVYASINFKDVMLATAKLIMDEYISRGRLEDCMIGMEYVGINSAGRRVMGLLEKRCIANMCIPYKTLCWYVPDEWTLDDAATVPCAYATCYYGLYVRTKMNKDDKVLIHSGTGAVGQAAINLALFEGCEVFTTVGTPEKRRFIRETFPSIPEDHIGNSRDTSFEQMIFQQTKGHGVDIVLNSLAEEKLQASIRCLAKGGRFLEIGKFDFMANNMLDLSVFSKGITFSSVMLDNFFTIYPVEDGRKLSKMVEKGLSSGAVKPISRKVFQRDEIESAFRYMAAGKHIGKIVIKIHKEDESMNAPILALPRYYCMANKTYVIFGGLGGFGLELADWLVIRGAKNLVLISRKGIKNGYQQMKVELWKSYGVKVSVISNVDASDVDDCERILRTAEKIAPVDAIFNLAVVLNDKICQNHTINTFQEPFNAKAWATRNLDQLSRKICLQLRHFVVFSSVSCGRGNAGQSNYGMANSVMERICERRVEEGLHGLAIQWGAVGDVGLVADMQDNDKEMVIGGTLQQKIDSCIEKLEEFLLQEHPVVASMVVAEKRSDFGTGNIVETVANIMGLKDLNNVARHTLLPELGMDSMMAVEIKQALEREFDVFLTAQDIRYLNFAKLIEMCDKDVSKDKSGRDESDITGIKLLVRLIGNDNPISDVCIDMPTKKNMARSEIFLIPGMEGCGSIFNSLTEHIEAPATCLQYGTYHIGTNCTSINDIADCLLKHILSKKKLWQNFVIVGYSLGSVIAIELVRKLEEMNFQGRLVLIDGAPEYMKAVSNQHLPFNTVAELENNILLGIMDTIQPVLSGKLLLELNKCTNWDQKLDIFLSHVPSTYKKSAMKYNKSVCRTIYERAIALHKYDVTQLPKIESPIILLKPTVQSVSFSQEDYGLHMITKGNVEVRYVEGNHITILDSDKVITAINEEHIKSVKNLKFDVTDDDNITSVTNIYLRS